MASVDTDIKEKLLALNRQFYQTFGEQFSSTRQRIQPGVARLMTRLPREASMLDVGCGNGELARRLSREGYRGPYVGVDFSLPLLEEARRRQTPPLEARFLQGDISTPGWAAPLGEAAFEYGFAFAVLHHLPGFATRLKVVRTLGRLLLPNGFFFHSHWHFLNSPRWRARIQPWELAGISPEAVEEGDYLLDWRHGGHGLRYVHVLSEEELALLAAQSGFRILETFYSDGKEGNLALYQVWQKRGV